MKQMRKKKILIVDDSEMNRDILTGMLEDEYEIVEAEDGEKAIEIMKDALVFLSYFWISRYQNWTVLGFYA